MRLVLSTFLVVAGAMNSIMASFYGAFMTNDGPRYLSMLAPILGGIGLLEIALGVVIAKFLK